MVCNERFRIQCRTCGENDLVLFHILPAHVHWLLQRKAQSLPLPDGVADDSFMFSEYMTVLIYEFSRRKLLPALRLYEIRIIAVHKTDVLGIMLMGVGESILFRRCPDLILRRKISQRENRMLQLLLTHEVQHIALILRKITGLFQKIPSGFRILCNTGIVTGHNDVAGKLFGLMKKLRMFHVAVTFNTRVRRTALFIRPDESLNDFPMEFLGKIHDRIRYAQLLCNLTCIFRFLCGTAGRRLLCAVFFL